ncbi:MAG: glycosyltransferase family 4 protein [Aquabacterium sp.]
MRILYINSFYAPDEIGGAEKSVRFLAETLQTRGHSTAVLTLGRQRERSTLNGVDIFRLPAPNLYYPADAGKHPGWKRLLWHSIDSFNPTAPKLIDTIIDDFRPDVVHTNNLSGFSVSVWSAIKSRSIPIVHTLRDYYLLCPNTAMFSGGKPCIGRCTSCKTLSIPRIAATKHVDVVVGNSEFILNKHIEHGLFRTSQSGVIYNAYSPTDDADRRPKEVLQLGFIGRLAPSKGLELLIDGLKEAQPSRPVNVLVAGEGEPSYVDTLKQRAAGLPIDFIGRVKPEDFYSQVHWTVVPSIWDEPLARVLFESFAHGVPVMGTATGGTPELVKTDRNGYLFSAQSSQSLARLIDQASSLPESHYTNMCELARQDGLKFVPSAVAQNYLHTYEAALKKNGTSHSMVVG